MASFNKKFESTKQTWETPKILFDKLNKEFNFEWDLAASKENALCEKYFDKENNALEQRWKGTCWLNPPYGDKSNKMVDWIKKAYDECQINPHLKVVMLIPARTNTKWFHEYCMKAAEIRFICGRPKFGDAKYGLPQPLCLVIFQQTIFPTRFKSFYLK